MSLDTVSVTEYLVCHQALVEKALAGMHTSLSDTGRCHKFLCLRWKKQVVSFLSDTDFSEFGRARYIIHLSEARVLLGEEQISYL